PLALEAEAVDQPVERGGEHVLVGRVRVLLVGARERDPVAADHGDPAGLAVHRLGVPFPGLGEVGWAAAWARARMPGSTVEIRSSAASPAEIASVRSHQRASSSAAPRRAAESASISIRARLRRGAGTWASSRRETSSTIWPR